MANQRRGPGECQLDAQTCILESYLVCNGLMNESQRSQGVYDSLASHNLSMYAEARALFIKLVHHFSIDVSLKEVYYVSLRLGLKV